MRTKHAGIDTDQEREHADAEKAQEPETISVPQAGRRLGIGPSAAYEAARRGDIPILQFGRRKVVPVRAFSRLLAGDDWSPPGKGQSA